MEGNNLTLLEKTKTIKTEEDDTRKVITFKKPVIFEGTEYKELILDFTKLTGQILIDAENEFNILGNRATVMQTNQAYLAILASKCANVVPEMIYSLSANKFTQIIIAVQVFLLGSD